jgi:DNA-binding HxlR family transcriptional regulator
MKSHKSNITLRRSITPKALCILPCKLEAEGILDVEMERSRQPRKNYKLTEKEGTTETVNRLSELEISLET